MQIYKFLGKVCIYVKWVYLRFAFVQFYPSKYKLRCHLSSNKSPLNRLLRIAWFIYSACLRDGKLVPWIRRTSKYFEGNTIAWLIFLLQQSREWRCHKRFPCMSNSTPPWPPNSVFTIQLKHKIYGKGILLLFKWCILGPRQKKWAEIPRTVNWSMYRQGREINSAKRPKTLVQMTLVRM